MSLLRLFIYFGKKRVGSLTHDDTQNKFSMEYDRKWKESGFILSPKLNFSDEIKSADVKNFIENLLPEGEGLELLSEVCQISKSNKFAMLQAIGVETTGAFTFSVNDALPKSSFREISVEELSGRIKDRRNVPITLWDEKVRLSVAGVQEKLNICFLNGKYGLGEGKISSTHILKFDKNSEQLVLNEFLSLRLASEAGLNVNEAEIVRFEDEEVLKVTRFDREIAGGEVNRIHIVDSVQALGLPVSFKYERNRGSQRDVKNIREGVSFEKLFSLVNSAVSPIEFKETLIIWSCVNLCLGNSDAHGKNISFFIHGNKLEITPIYDLVNITLYEKQYDIEMAMAIDDQFNIKELTPYDISEFLSQNNISKKGYIREFKKVSKSIVSSLEDSGQFGFNESPGREEFFIKYKKNTLDRIDTLHKLMHHLQMPTNEKECLSYYKRNRERIEDVLSAQYIKSNNVEDIVFEYFYVSEP